MDTKLPSPPRGYVHRLFAPAISPETSSALWSQTAALTYNPCQVVIDVVVMEFALNRCPFR